MLRKHLKHLNFFFLGEGKIKKGVKIRQILYFIFHLNYLFLLYGNVILIFLIIYFMSKYVDMINIQL